MHTYYDSTGDKTTTTGSGTLTGNGSAPTGYRAPGPVGVQDGDYTTIRIQNADNTVWEVCESVISESAGVYTYSRGTLLQSSTGSRISFSSGVKSIFFTISEGGLGVTGPLLFEVLDTLSGPTIPSSVAAGQALFMFGDVESGVTTFVNFEDLANDIFTTGAISDGDKGDITVSGSGSVWTVDNSAITYAKIQNVSATDKVLGRSSAGAGVIQEITLTAAGRALIDDADASAQRTTLGLGTLATQNGTFSGASSGTNTGDQTITLTGDVTGGGTGSFAATIANNAVTLAKIAQVATDSILGRASSSTGNVEVLTALPFAFTGDVTRAADSNAQTIANSAVTLAKMADMATSSLIYRKTAGTGTPEVNTLATLKTDLGLTGTNSGDQTITLTGDVTGAGTGSFAATIATSAVSLAKMADMATASLIYRKTAGTGAPEINTLATLKTDLGLTGTNSGDQTLPTDATIVTTDVTTNNATTSKHGWLPKLPGGTTSFLRADGAFATPAGSGGDLISTNNLSDVASAATSRTNLSAAASGANTDITSVLLNQAGLVVKGASSNALTIKPNETLSSARILNIVTGDATRTLTFTGDTSLTGTNTGDQTITLTGDVTGAGTGSFAATIANNAVTLAKIATMATDSILGRTTASTGNVEVLTALPFAYTGDVTRPADSNATTIATAAVTLAKMADMATSSLIYRKTAGTGVPEVNTLATLKTDLALTGTNSGDQTITLTGDVTGAGTGSFAATIASNAVSLAKMAQVATDSILGRASSSTGNVEVLTALPFAFTGDVTRAADSNAQTIANSAVTLAKMADMATSSLIYRKTAGTGAPEVNTLATLKTDLGLTGTNTGDQVIPIEIQVAISDLTTNLATGTSVGYFRAPVGFTLTAVRASVLVAQTAGSILQFDVNVNGSTILSTKLTIDNSEKTSVTAATAAVISSGTIVSDDEITIDIDTVGTALAKGAIITFIGTR